MSKPREFWIYKETALLLESRNINIHDQHLFVHAIDYDSYKDLQRKLDIAKTALEYIATTNHGSDCDDLSNFEARDALKEINK